MRSASPSVSQSTQFPEQEYTFDFENADLDQAQVVENLDQLDNVSESNVEDTNQIAKDEILTALAVRLDNFNLPAGDELLEDLAGMDPHHAMDRIRLICLADNTNFDVNLAAQLENMKEDWFANQNNFAATLRMSQSIEKIMHKDLAKVHKSWMQRSRQDNINIMRAITDQMGAMIDLLAYRMDVMQARMQELSQDIEELSALQNQFETENMAQELLRASVEDAGYIFKTDEEMEADAVAAQDDVNFDDLNSVAEAEANANANAEAQAHADQAAREAQEYDYAEFADDIDSNNDADEDDNQLDDVEETLSTASTKELSDYEDHADETPVLERSPSRHRSPSPVARHLTAGANERVDSPLLFRSASRSPSPLLFGPKMPQLKRADAASSAELEAATARLASPVRK